MFKNYGITGKQSLLVYLFNQVPPRNHHIHACISTFRERKRLNRERNRDNLFHLPKINWMASHISIMISFYI